MKKIVFFSIPAYGHTNLTIEVVHELTKAGNKVWYYSFNEFKEKIEGAGAKFISCDNFIQKLNKKDEKRVGKDFSFLIEMVVDMTLALDEKVSSDLKKIKLLRENGYKVDNIISLVSNNNDTKTIVYTSKEFQPLSETFGSKYAFVGPSVAKIEVVKEDRKKKKIYISLGTVNNKNNRFYKNCIKAFKDTDIDVIMSIGKSTNISDLGEIPKNFVIKNVAQQIKVLQDVDLFITHSGMNSVNESLYYGVPMVLYPRQSEQGMVANRVSELKAGILLKKNDSIDIKEAALKVLNNDTYKEGAKALENSFVLSGGAKKAADFIVE